MSSTIEVVERGRRIAFTFDDVLDFHGGGSPGGAAIAFKLLELVLPLLDPDGPCERREVAVETAFGGPGARDCFELVTRAVSDDRYGVDAALARPARGRALERFVFRLGYRGRSVTLALRPGFVTDEFIELARTEPRSREQERRLDGLKRELADRVMARRAADVFDVDEPAGAVPEAAARGEWTGTDRVVRSRAEALQRRLDRVGAAADGEVAAAYRLAARRADRQRVELGAAAVAEDDGLGAGVDVAVAPLLEREQDRVQLLAGRGQQVLVARRPLGVAPPLDHTARLELSQPRREHVARRSRAHRELLEAGAPVADLAHDEQRVAVADDVEGVGDRADPGRPFHCDSFARGRSV